ncbi:inverted formin-2-like isoform X1 [Argiope bruennichi]|uniref:inverted formin-2-like isoform X1 n=1 Tax=Argiope bruennichi TaxID=94029 RepID=UPI00249583F8|nr:inverted formin-2-like isoform X1 [Argiope bruennichi]
MERSLASTSIVFVGITFCCHSGENFLKSPAFHPNGEDNHGTRWTAGVRSIFRHSHAGRSPGDLANELRTPSPSLYLELRKCLKDPEWARSFVRENGIDTLLETLKSLRGRNLEEVQLKVECGQCLRLVMDTRVGLDYIMENADYTQKLVTALDTDDIPVKKQVFELLSALCVYRPDGYIKALETLEHYKNLKKHRYRLQMVVDELKSSDVAEYTTALIAFVNCLIISPAALSERVRIRNEFLGLKILGVLNRFRQQCQDGSHSDLAVQLDVFDEQRATDEGQFSGPDGVDLSSHMDVFFAILRQVAETPQEIPFLSILQHLLRTDLSQPLSELIWETVETLVHRATLLESKQEADRLLRASNLGGLRCHCSCHYRQNSLVLEDCEIMPGKKNKPNQLSFCSSDGMRTPTTLLSPSHPPTPCDLISSPLPSSHASKSPWKVALQRQNLALSPSESQVTSSKMETTNSKCLKPDSVSENIPHNVPQIVKTNIQCDNIVDFSKSATVVSEECSNNIRDLSEISNVPPPPPPPPPIGYGCPPPPPPPPLAPLRLQPQIKNVITDMTLPQTDTPKPKAKMKSLNWSKIPLSKVIGKDNLWSRIAKDHAGSPNDLDFDTMEKLFCQQPMSTNGHISPRFGDSNDGSDKKRKEIQEINLLDGKRSLNINIFIKQFRSSNENIVRILKEGAHEDLGAERLRGLLKILPEADEVDILKNFDGDKTKLGSAEKFLLQLIEVPSYKLRVESMLLKEEFLANQEFLENSIETIRCAAQELEECRKLHEILYRVLVAGNFLNAGGYAGNAAGFKMLSLLKLTDIRANKPSVTLIHYVAEEVLKKRPDLLEFPDEIRNLEEASKISMETLKTDVSSLCQRVCKVSTQVATANDEIKAQMQDFIEFAQSKMEGIQNEINELENVRQHLADFLCEESSAFKLEDCFRVFHSFCTRFKAAVQENERRQKQEQLAEARRKQREQQMAFKRRSLELPDARSGADFIMDELLGDIRSGFPERRLGRRDPDDRLKRHSDPAMLGKCGDLDDRLDTFKNRRARFLDETNGKDIVGFLQNSSAVDGDRRSFGSMEDSLERVSFRRSGRRKRVVMEINGDTQSRERSGSSPPPQAILPSAESQEPEVDSKQRLRSKINDWMLQNEIEQKRERDLQLKLLQERKKRLSNGQLMNSDASNVEKNILEEIEETDMKQRTFKEICSSDLLRNNSSLDNNDNFKITKNALSRRSESFTQKIIGLIDATSNKSKPFAKTRLYSSARDSGAIREELENKSKDESQISSLGYQNTTQDASKKPGDNFDRFAPTRKTQRRLKLREMRIEAENINTVRQEEKKSDPRVLSPCSLDSSIETDSSFVRDEIKKEVDGGFSRNCFEKPPDSNSAMILVRKEACANVSETDRESIVFDSDHTQEVLKTKNETETDKEGTAFSRQKNTSLRSRQSRLARRINSLSTSLTSPDSAESSAVISKCAKDKENPAKSEPKFPTNDGETCEQENDPKQRESCEKKSSDSIPINDEISLKPNHVEKKDLKGNGHISHKVTVSTETKSKIIISKSSASSQNSQIASSSKSRVPFQKAATNIPGIMKTTRNVRIHQTVQGADAPVNDRTVMQKAENRVPLTSKRPVPVKVKVLSSIKQPRVNNLTNSETLSSKNASPTSSVSSLCNVSSNVKLIKNGKTVNAEKTNANKITIRHNGSVKFMKSNSSFNKPGSNLNSTPKMEKSVTSRKRAFI